MKEQIIMYDVRAVVMENLTSWVKDFKSCMMEVMRDTPSVSVKIAGMDFKQMSCYQAFHTLIEVENSIDDKTIKTTEEDNEQIKLWFHQMKDESQRILGIDEYNKWYSFLKKDTY